MKPLIYLLVLLLVASESVYGQILPDNQLYAKGYQAIKNANWQNAREYLFAYLQRNPIDLLKNVSYASQVNNAFKVANDNIAAEKKAMLDELENLRQFKADAQARNGLGTTTRGIEVRTTQPSLPSPSTMSANPWKHAIGNGPDVPIQGEWTIVQTSTNGTVSNGKIFIVTSPDIISGELTLTNQPAAAITGMYDGTHLILLSRNGTNTLQTISLIKKSKYLFSGTYKNEDTVADEGIVDVSRINEIIDTIQGRDKRTAPEVQEVKPVQREVKPVQPGQTPVKGGAKPVKGGAKPVKGGIKRVER